MSSGEFDIIARYFNRQGNTRKDVRLGIGDDCALLVPSQKQYLAISTDTLVSGIHFLPDIDPADLGYKALAVNLSDLAAMGADPAWVSLALTLPEINEPWLDAFSDSFFRQLNYYGMQLIGGDTTKGPLSLTLTINGWVPMNKELTRGGAKVGNWIYVTGWLGDSAAGLAILQDQLQVEDKEARDYLVKRHLRPTPRILMGQGMRQLATSAIDLSDGLISDLGHILKASGCGAKVYLDRLVFSKALSDNCHREQAIRWALSGGEDYELCFTVPEDNRGALDTALSGLGIPYTCIGQITANNGLQLFDGNQPVKFAGHGFDHFS
ncbi:thiamine-phosphate kinase [Pragia fontium]|uniref:Thiamine-monophosphate kinase n=2 Tax=Pragia fontium TaxID=82985 RepID=A0AAJ5BHA9_9GAMM|nr:thiamine-phosphate kinase [Pragia fontium]GKX62349.1 thiamine-monophosphate kinase [Pragia fontium]SFC88195.1 thiamine-monophosphate kinase [Pragia fontium DSM 5563 = ATCC 49100]SUB83152.1 Thiamine-monophosphate kinase [Pragia fontium]VEJ56046.1 Thiamine-monophosphate kinase [Pragia fontium]